MKPEVREARSRARAVLHAWDALGGPSGVPTSHGVVEVERVVLDDTAEELALEVYVTDPVGGDPSFRIINPPIMVPDPNGSAVLKDGRRARIDPMAAVAEAIAMHGGARRSPRR